MRTLFLIITFLGVISCSTETERTQLTNDQPCRINDRDTNISLSKELASINEFLENKTGVYILEEGENAMISRAWFSEYAENTIDIQYFIFSTDNIGLIACDYLVRAADRGVKIRILVDDIMVDADEKDLLLMDSHKNISIKIYNPGTNVGKNLPNKLVKLSTDFEGVNQRMHNKTFIVDGKVAITGGRNIADEYFDYDHEYNFKDRDVLLFGKIVSEITYSFEDFWESGLSVPVNDLISSDEITDTLQGFKLLHQYACNDDNFNTEVREKIKNFPRFLQNIQNSKMLSAVDSIIYISDNPGKNDGNKGLSGGGICTESLIELINKAEKSIDIQSPYLVTTDFGKAIFKAVINRGVKVRILTNSLSSTDNSEAFSGYQRDRDELLKTGIRIFEFKPNAKACQTKMKEASNKNYGHTPIFGLHAKSMVIDDSIAVIGTFNLDPRSANLNTECVTIIYSSRISNTILNSMNEYFKEENSWETTYKFNPDAHADYLKRFKTWTRRVVPKSIL